MSQCLGYSNSDVTRNRERDTAMHKILLKNSTDCIPSKSTMAHLRVLDSESDHILRLATGIIIIMMDRYKGVMAEYQV